MMIDSMGACTLFGYIEIRYVPTSKILDDFSNATSFEALTSDDKTNRSSRNFALLPP